MPTCLYCDMALPQNSHSSGKLWHRAFSLTVKGLAIGRDLAHARSYSEGIASAIDQEVKKIIDDAYAKAKEMIQEHREVLDRCAEILLEKEKISREEFEALFD